MEAMVAEPGKKGSGMNRKKLINSLSKKLNASKKDCGKIVNAFVDCAIEGIKEDGVFQITDFGTLKSKALEPKEGHNPRTGMAIVIPGRSQVFFSAGKRLKDAIN
jgi:nucleoid DNA-binding protein